MNLINIFPTNYSYFADFVYKRTRISMISHSPLNNYIAEKASICYGNTILIGVMARITNELNSKIC